MPAVGAQLDLLRRKAQCIITVHAGESSASARRSESAAAAFVCSQP
jgi:hypothetical protein